MKIRIAGKAAPFRRGCLVIMHKTDIQKLCNMPPGGGTFITMNTMYNCLFDSRIIGPNRAEKLQRSERYGFLRSAYFVQFPR